MFMTSRTRMIPRRMSDFTVPSGILSRAAISDWVNPYSNPSSNTVRCSGRSR